jgi:heme exporter protein CcmD
MTTYTPYLVSSYGVAFIAMFFLLIWVRRQRQRTLKRLKQWFKRDFQ